MAARKKATETKPLGIHGKISLISKEMGFLEFDKKNSGQGYKYASAAGVIRKLQNLLVEHGVTRRCISRRIEVFPGEGNKSNLAITTAAWEWRDIETGEFIHTESMGMGKDSGDKAVMKSATADNKYDIAHTLCLAWGAEDPEDDSKETSRKSTKTKASLGGLKVVLGSIAAADTLVKLEALKDAVRALSAADQSTAKEAFRSRRAELSA